MATVVPTVVARRPLDTRGAALGHGLGLFIGSALEQHRKQLIGEDIAKALEIADPTERRRQLAAVQARRGLSSDEFAKILTNTKTLREAEERAATGKGVLAVMKELGAYEALPEDVKKGIDTGSVDALAIVRAITHGESIVSKRGERERAEERFPLEVGALRARTAAGFATAAAARARAKESTALGPLRKELLGAQIKSVLALAEKRQKEALAIGEPKQTALEEKVKTIAEALRGRYPDEKTRLRVARGIATGLIKVKVGKDGTITRVDLTQGEVRTTPPPGAQARLTLEDEHLRAKIRATKALADKREKEARVAGVAKKTALEQKVSFIEKTLKHIKDPKVRHLEAVRIATGQQGFRVDQRGNIVQYDYGRGTFKVTVSPVATAKTLADLEQRVATLSAAIRPLRAVEARLRSGKIVFTGVEGFLQSEVGGFVLSTPVIRSLARLVGFPDKKAVATAQRNRAVAWNAIVATAQGLVQTSGGGGRSGLATRQQIDIAKRIVNAASLFTTRKGAILAVRQIREVLEADKARTTLQRRQGSPFPPEEKGRYRFREKKGGGLELVPAR